MADKLRQRAQLEENYDEDKRNLMRQKAAIYEQENEFSRERFRLMEKVYSMIPRSTHDLTMLDSKLHQLHNTFLVETDRAQSRLEDETRALNVSFNTALENLM